MKKKGLVGFGNMGKSMVRNLMKDRCEVSIYKGLTSTVEDFIVHGAIR